MKTRIAENIDKEFLTDTENFNSEKHMPEIHALIQISMLLTDFGILSLFDQISHLSLGEVGLSKNNLRISKTTL